MMVTAVLALIYCCAVLTNGQQCPIAQGDLANYIRTNPNVFSTRAQAQAVTIPGSTSAGIRVTWGLTYPICMTSVCVRFENRQDEIVGTECPSDVTTSVIVKQGFACNTYITAIVQAAAGGRARSDTASEIYFGGSPTRTPSTPPPSIRVHVEDRQVVLTWGELDCLNTNAQIRFYFVSFGRVGQGSTSLITTEREVRSSLTSNSIGLGILNLNLEYQFSVAASNQNGIGPYSTPISVIPANASPPPTIPPTTLPPTTRPTTPPPTTLPPTTPPPTSRMTTAAPTAPQTTMPPSTTTLPPPTTQRTLTTPTTKTADTSSTEPADRVTTNDVTNEDSTAMPTESDGSTKPFIVTDSNTDSTESPRESAVGAIVGVLTVIILVLLSLSAVLVTWMFWRHRSVLKRHKSSSISLSGAYVVNDVFLELSRDSQLLETETQPRGPSKDPLYDELKATEPKIKNYKRNIHIGEGEEVNLKVDFSGFPKPNIDWFYDGMRLDTDSLNGREILNDGSVYIRAVEGKHAGTYDFIVSNSMGSVEGCSKLIVYVEEKAKLTLDRKKKNGSKLESHLVKKERFGDHVSHCHTFNNKGFTAEYQSLLSGEGDEMVTVGRTGENRFKNRFKNITPYDKNRLLLEPINYPECQYDYINASYIDGYVKAKRYIAAQGPLPSTILDFWRMVWQEKVQTIAMVTNLTEGRQKKCEQYWPDSGSAEYGPFMVTLTETQTFADYTIRTLQLLTLEHIGSTRNIRKISHFQFTSWPDHGVPEYAGPLLSYLHRIKGQHKPTKGPILVHCSAGVGRTGTMITIDIALAQAARESVIDIAGIVCKIRTQRMKMVQSAEQYAYIHDAVLESITCGETQIPASGLKRAITKLSNKNRETGLTGFETQFEVLEKVGPQSRDMPRTVALRCTEKNRSNEFLPPDRCRVWLKAQNMERTYVHASYLDGYRQKSAFIIAQAPMKNTTEEFWKMIYERECTVIVMLSGLEELEEECCYRYWPDTEAKASFNGEKHGAHTIFTLERKRQEGFLMRTFGITDPKGENMRRVTQFQMAGWSQDGVCINPVAMMKLIDKLFIAQRRTGDHPLVVHGSNTVSRCAVFCAFLNCIEGCKSESVVDVFQTIKAMRIQKPGAIQTVEQYCCVYDMMSLYLSSFSLYSNFK